MTPPGTAESLSAAQRRVLGAWSPTRSLVAGTWERQGSFILRVGEGWWAGWRGWPWTWQEDRNDQAVRHLLTTFAARLSLDHPARVQHRQRDRAVRERGNGATESRRKLDHDPQRERYCPERLSVSVWPAVCRRGDRQPAAGADQRPADADPGRR